MSNTTRNDVKQLAQQIETLAREIQMKLDSGTDFISTANELARNNVTLIVDDKQKVADRLFEHTGERISALESQKIHESHIQNQMPVHHAIHEL